jgi:hypothetical protein
LPDRLAGQRPGGLAAATALTILLGFFPGLILGIIGEAARALAG